MATSNEGIRFTGDLSNLQKTLDFLEKQLLAVSEAYGLTAKLTANLSKQTKDGTPALRDISVQLTKTNDANQKFRAGLKLTGKELNEMVLKNKDLRGELKDLAGGLKRTSVTVEGDAAALKKRNLELAEAARLQRNLAKQIKAQGAIRGQLAARAPGRKKGSVQEGLNVSKAEDSLKRVAKQSRVTEKAIKRIFADAARGEIRDYGTEVNKVRNAVFNLVKAENQLGAAAERAAAGAAAGLRKAQKEAARTLSTFKKLQNAVVGLARVGAVSLFIGSLFRLQQAFEDGLLAAAEYSIKIAEIETIQGKATLSTEQWANELKNLSNEFGLDVLDQAEGAYQTLSTQIAKGGDAIEFLTTANKLALAGVTDVSSAVVLTATALNAYGKDASQAADISGKLFKTVELGVVRIEELKSGLGRISVPAAKLGIRFEELLAAIAVTTRQGVKFNEAATLIRGIIQKTIKPTGEMSKLLADMGFATGEAAIGTLGLGGFLAALDKRTKGSTTELGKLFNRVRAVTGGLIFAGDGVNVFKDTLKDIDASGVETLEKATARIQATLGKRFDRLTQRIRNFFVVDVGPPVLGTLIDIAEATGDALKFMAGAFKSTFGVIANTIGIFTGGVREAALSLNDLTGGNLGKALSFLAKNLGIAAKAVANFTAAVLSSKPAVVLLQAAITFLAVVALPKLIFAMFSASVTIVTYTAFLLGSAKAALLAAVGYGTASAALLGFAAIAAAAVVTYKAVEHFLQRDERAADAFTASVARNTAEIAKQRKELEKLRSEEIIQGIRERNIAINEALAKENQAIQRANAIRLDALKDLKDENARINKDILGVLKKRLSAAKSEFNKFSKVVIGTAGDIKASFLAASKDLFSFDISIAADKTQLKILDNQLTSLQFEQQQAALDGDKTRFDRVTKQIKTVSKQRFSVITKINKAQRDADQTVFKARADLIRAEGKGDKEAIQAAKDKLKDVKARRRVVGTAGKEELDVAERIVQIRRELSRTRRGSAESDALKVELDAARKLQVSLSERGAEEERQREKIVSLFEEERKLRLDLADELAKKAKVAFREQLKQQLIIAEITALEKKRRDFNLEGLIKGGDQKKLRKESIKQVQALEKLANLQAKLGLTSEEDRLKLEKEIFLIRKTSVEALIKGKNTDLVQDIKNIETRGKKELAEAAKLNEQQNKADLARVDSLTGSLIAVREALGGLDRGDLQKTLATETETGAQVQAKLITEGIDKLLKQLKNPDITEVELGDVSALATRIAEAVQRGNLAGGSARFDRGQNDLRAIKGTLDVAGLNLSGQVGQLTDQLALANKEAGRGVAGAQEEADRLESLLKGARRAEEAGQAAKPIQQLVEEIAARQEKAKGLRATFDTEIKQAKARLKANEARIAASRTFDSVTDSLSGSLARLRDDINELDFEKAFVRQQLELSRKASGVTDPATATPSRGGKLGRTQGKQNFFDDLGLAGSKSGAEARRNSERAVAPVVVNNAKDAAKAVKPIVVQNAKDAGKAQAKAQFDESVRLQKAAVKAQAASEAQAKKLREQKKKTPKDAKLTGFAARVRAADERARKRKTGEGTAFAQRKKEAEARQAQRDRNSKFLADRREKKAVETRRAQAQVDAKTGAQTPGGILVRQIEEAKKASTTGTDAEKAAAATRQQELTKKLDALVVQQAKAPTATPTTSADVQKQFQAQIQAQIKEQQKRADTAKTPGEKATAERFVKVLQERLAAVEAAGTSRTTSEKRLTEAQGALLPTKEVPTVDLLDENKPTQLLVEALNKNTAALSSLQATPGSFTSVLDAIQGAPGGQGRFGNLPAPSAGFQPQLLPRLAPVPLMDAAPGQTVITVPITVENTLDSGELNKLIKTTTRQDSTRQTRQNRNRATRPQNQQ